MCAKKTRTLKKWTTKKRIECGKAFSKLSREEPMMMGDPKMMVKIKRMIVVG
jgi:hypothetical protein